MSEQKTAESVAKDFANLLEQLKEGSEEAARQLLERYGDAIIRVIRRKLDSTLRRRYDSQDFAQAVWASFFENLQTIADFESPERLTNFLATMAANKVVDAGRKNFQAAKRNLVQEQSLESLPRPLAANIATPSETAIAREEWDRLLQRQPSKEGQDILKLRGGGATCHEIAERIGVPEKAVQRVLEKIQKKSENQ